MEERAILVRQETHPGAGAQESLEELSQLARRTGAPVYPVTYGAAWNTHIGSWDRLIIPFPFSKVRYVVGQSVSVPADASPELMEEKRQELECTLQAITAQADALADASSSLA